MIMITKTLIKADLEVKPTQFLISKMLQLGGANVPGEAR